MGRISDVLYNKEDNYILPFFWMHGAAKEDTRRLMRAVYDCGIRAVCLESRPHPDYVGEQWWQDVDIILEEAGKYGMKVWILDDSHFPTGFANGAAGDAPRNLKRISLVERHYDVSGPQKGKKLDISRNMNINPQTRQSAGAYYQEKLEMVLLARIEEKVPGRNWQPNRALRDVKNVTEQVENGWLYLDLPEGEYRIYVLTTKLHAAMMLGDGISLLEKDSVRLLIDEVYEAHYKKYASYFGNTIAGFFSDEPGFFNLSDRGYGYAPRTGEESVPIPWTEDVYAKLKDTFGDRTEGMLPFLFGDCGTGRGEEKAIRVTYMDIISKKYAENFSGQLGEWCREHRVEYIGHIVEDYPGYERLGQSAAHYFRAVRGQDMAGIDIVLNGLLPDEDEGKGMFYHYGLAQLAGSLANQTPRQKGRAICEIFGAYGWAEGVTLMKWMADHMLTGGINYFVPHAFTDNAFPDPDCPPHFWAEGNNPQYPFMQVLFGYMNRMAHLLSAGEPLVRSAVLFEAESDWAGDTQPYFILGKALMLRQVPYHVVCLDDLGTAEVEAGMLHIGNMRYKQLFISKASFMQKEAAELLQELRNAGAAIFFVDGKPEDYSGEELQELLSIPCISEERMQELASAAASLRVIVQDSAEGAGEEKICRWLRCYSYRQEGINIHMLQNVSSREAVAGQVVFADSDLNMEIIRYDGMEQKVYRTDMSRTADGKQSILLRLGPMESVVYLEGRINDEKIRELLIDEPKENAISTYEGGYRIEKSDYDKPEVWEYCGTEDTLFDIARKFPGFAGKVRYELEFENRGYCAVLLEKATEAVEVYCDGISLGKRIAPPYRYELPKFPDYTTHRIRIEVSTTLVNAIPDLLSCQRLIEPTGFLGKVCFLG